MASRDLDTKWILAALMAVFLGHVVWVDAATTRRVVAFEEVDVQRINVREPDGTLRMVISNSRAAPGTFVKGREIARPDRRDAGILFVNEEGTENGGLSFGGRKVDGKVIQNGHLSFDQYEQDQVISLDQGESDGERHATLSFSDRPDVPLPWDLMARLDTPAGQAELRKMEAAGGFGVQRVRLGKTPERSSVLELKDAKGRVRLVLKVAAEGAATIDFLDETGKVTRTITPR
jgi:hypothetical protein